MGHPGTDVVEKLPTSVSGVKLAKGPTAIKCEVCAISKAHQIISRRPTSIATKPFERVHFDLVYMSEAYNVERYFSHFYDEVTMMNHVYTHSSKTQCPKAIQDYVALVERRYG